MGTGWRRAFCTSIPRDPEPEKQQNPSPSPSPRSCAKLSFFSNPSTPRLQSQPVASPSLRCRTTLTSPTVQDSPRLLCKTTPTSISPRLFQGSNPSSPKSPSRFALFKSPRLRLSKSSCGICLQSVKTGQGTAIFTAECAHAFHFPCIAAHVRKQGCLVCPVCNATWREVPLLAIHKQQPETNNDAVEEEKPEKPKSAHYPLKTLSESRLYDDDEPLISPRFNPIPEADEDDGEEEEIGEFQGFFTKPSTKSEAVNVEDSARVVDARLLPEAAIVSVGRSHESYAVALRVKAPAPPPVRNGADHNRRAPVDLVTVLDVSGSMTGAKLHMLKRAMRLVVASLGPADRLSIVAFSGSAKRLLPLRRMTPHGQRAARRIVDRLACGNGTCVGEALRKATKVLEDRRERNPVASIMLLSDGQDERSAPQESAARRRLTSSSAPSTRFAHVEIPVHSFGFGASSGAHSHDAFAKCIGGLLSVVVQDLRLHLGFSSGEIAGVYSCMGRPTLLGSSSIRLGDLYAEEERELLLELRVPAASIGAHHVMSVRFSYRDPATQEVVHCKEQAVLVPRPHAVRSSDPKIERLRNFFITTRAMSEARRMTEHNDLSGAHHLLTSARALLLQSSSISADANLRGLEAELAELQMRRQHLHQQILQQQQQQQQPQQHYIQRRRSEHPLLDDNGEPLTPTSAWRAAEQLAKVAIMRKSMNRVSDLHGFENARF
ncbi:E3 ubiquitin-protein ligase WAV3-like [Aristolochia californica]|uniref:E3 ubiquitin-protein ligase WAV3-like n=1 Tax=Aristolochia californica TaxID=171875 RepID=UPI0035D73EFB